MHDLMQITKLVTVFETYTNEEAALKSFANNKRAASAALMRYHRLPGSPSPFENRGGCQLSVRMIAEYASSRIDMREIRAGLVENQRKVSSRQQNRIDWQLVCDPQ